MKSQRQHIIVLIAGFLLWSCSTDKSDYAKLVSEWQGRDIIFPKIMTDVLTGDTIDLKDADFTILTYIDSAGCTSCRMKLPIWREFMNSLDSLPSAPEVNNLIAINTDDKEELEYLIKYNAYPFPIIQDSCDSLNLLNNFPSKQKFRTFLLDRDLNIIAIGNPVNNQAIAELYRNIISGHTVVNKAGDQIIEVGNPIIDIGNVHHSEEKVVEFKIINHGCDSILIDNVISSCHCTIIEFEDSLLLPGSQSTLRAIYKGVNTSGDFEQIIYINYQGFSYPTVLTITGKNVD